MITWEVGWRERAAAGVTSVGRLLPWLIPAVAMSLIFGFAAGFRAVPTVGMAGMIATAANVIRWWLVPYAVVLANWRATLRADGHGFDSSAPGVKMYSAWPPGARVRWFPGGAIVGSGRGGLFIPARACAGEPVAAVRALLATPGAARAVEPGPGLTDWNLAYRHDLPIPADPDRVYRATAVWLFGPAGAAMVVRVAAGTPPHRWFTDVVGALGGALVPVFATVAAMVIWARFAPKPVADGVVRTCAAGSAGIWFGWPGEAHHYGWSQVRGAVRAGEHVGIRAGQFWFPVPIAAFATPEDAERFLAWVNARVPAGVAPDPSNPFAPPGM